MTTITELKKLLFSMILKTPIWLVHLAANQSSVMSRLSAQSPILTSLLHTLIFDRRVFLFRISNMAMVIRSHINIIFIFFIEIPINRQRLM